MLVIPANLWRDRRVRGVVIAVVIVLVPDVLLVGAVIVAVLRRRIARSLVERVAQRQRAVDQEAEERQQRHGPEPLGGGAAQRMRCHGHVLQRKQHQPLSRLMFWRLTVCR